MLQVNRAFSAWGLLILQILGRRPRLAMTLRRWRNPILSGHTAFPRRDHRVAVLMFFLLAIAPISTFGAAKNRPLPQLTGYKAVPVHYGPLNKMIMSVQINGQPANLLVDTGANEIILDADTAQSFGVKPSQRGLRYIRRTQINGQLLFVGFAQSINAGSMNFGSNLVALRNPTHSGTGSEIGRAHV